jgi:hypothetical protein
LKLLTSVAGHRLQYNMTNLSIGLPSTLGSYLQLCNIFFGEESVQVRFINQKIAASPNGADEEVVAEESQMMYLLFNLPPEGSDEMKELLA